MFEYRDIALIRSPALPGGLPDPWPDLLGDGTVAARQRQQWIGRTWAVPEVADAIEAASPDLAARLAGICAGRPSTPRQQKRAAVSLARYLLRMQHRSTPFGLLAGVVPARITSDLDAGEDTGGQAVAGADSGWLAAVISGLEAVPDLLTRLAVRADPTWIVRDRRVVISCRQHAGPDAGGAPQEVSVRDSRAVRMILARAETPVPVAALVTELAAEFPGAPAGAASALVAALVKCGVLVSSLHAPMTVTDGLAHLSDQLSAVSADDIPAAAPAARIVREAACLLARHATATTAERCQIRAAASQRMRDLSPSAIQPVTIDLRLGWAAELPQIVAREAAKAAETLTRLTANPDGTGPWREYHARFLDRYGSGAVVRVIALTDPYTGLGMPDGYRGTGPATRPAPDSRDETVLALAQQAALDHATEVSLSRGEIDGLALAGEVAVLPHLDLCFQLHAPSGQAVREGRFTLAVVSMTPAAGSMNGRFLRLLNTADRDRMAAGYAALPTLDPAAVHVQISSPPLLSHAENVSRAPAVWPGIISLAEHPVGPAIGLRDLAVTADDRNMYLLSARDGRRIEPVMLNTVEAAHFTHPMARFLCELPRARTAVPGPFPWGPAGRLPYLPRVRYGRVILAPATWRIGSESLPPPGRAWQEWEAALHAQRQRFSIPAAVYAGDGDQRLRLDLNETAHVQLLHASQRAGEPVVLREAPGPEALSWLGGRAHEIAISLAAVRPARMPGSLPATAVRRRVGREYDRFPGDGQHSVVTLHGHTPMIAVRLPDLLAALDHELSWWFTRPGPPEQLRLWLTGSFGDRARNISTWARKLQHDGLLGEVRWETDYPHPARTGPAMAVAAAENAFTADSYAAVAMLAMASSAGPSRQAVAVASILDLVVSFTGSTAAGLTWVSERLTPGSPAPRPARALRDETVKLACTAGDFVSRLTGQPGYEVVRAACEARRLAVARYAAQLSADGSQFPDDALLSLVRDHHERVNGPGQDGWQLTMRLARSAALAALAQAEASA